MSETRTFPREVLWSALCGTLICRDFSKVHECIEYLAGCPVWTHQLPGWSRRSKRDIADRFPELSERPEGLGPDTYEQWRLDQSEDHLAEMIAVPKGCLPFASGEPFEGLPEDKSVIVVTDDAA